MFKTVVMDAQQLLNGILPILHSVKEDYTTPNCSDSKCSELRYFHAAICVG